MTQADVGRTVDPRAPLVLVVDDDDAVRKVVRLQLDDAGFRVVEADDGASALRRIRDDHPTLVVLDLSLPRLGGLDVLRAVRGGKAGRSDTPVSVLSGRSVRSVLRRSAPDRSGETIVVGGLSIEPGSRRVLRADEEIDLTPKEFDLLVFLSTHPRQVFTRSQLLDRVWNCSSEWLGEATVTEHVHRLRLKLEPDPALPRLLRTVRGVGYQLMDGG